MMYGSLFFKLQREDGKRRLWAAALLLLGVFFAMPVSLALSMGNAFSTKFRAYNLGHDFPIPNDGSVPDLQYQTMLTDLKTEAALDVVSFGSPLVVMLVITASVVVGVSGFSYLHSRKKVDFYHSLPVRRELLFAVQYVDGLVIAAAALLAGMLGQAAAAAFYGIPLSALAGAMAKAFLLHLLFYSLMYSVVTAAMLLTGSLLVGLLGTGVLFLFLPGVMLLLIGFCETFFITTAHNAWSAEGSPLFWGLQYLSPLSAYLTAVVKEGDWREKEGAAVRLGEIAVFAAITGGNLLLYRLRPSEAAGRAMAFWRSKAPIRILLVLAFGMAGGLFFWTLQSKVIWAAFGVVTAVLLMHCVTEIIYSSNFKKLFSHPVQMAGCILIAVLGFVSFRYDWYGYDSYLPKTDEIVSVSLGIRNDENWIHGDRLRQPADKNGAYMSQYELTDDFADETMQLPGDEMVMTLVTQARLQTLRRRERMLSKWESSGSAGVKEAEAEAVIGGADGATSIWVAGQEEADAAYWVWITVGYRLKNGRQVLRTYSSVDLAPVLEAYQAIYASPEYKEGLYYILKKRPEDYTQVLYRTWGRVKGVMDAPEAVAALLTAYQKDLGALTAEQRMTEHPVGSLAFVTPKLLEQAEAYGSYNHYVGADLGGQNGYRLSYLEDNVQFWPLYPGFSDTIAAMEKWGITLAGSIAPEQVQSVEVQAEALFPWDSASGGWQLPQGEELRALQEENPAYQSDGRLIYTDPASIRVLTQAAFDDDEVMADDILSQGRIANIYASISMKDGSSINCSFDKNKITPEFEALFKGLPLTRPQS